MIIDDIEKQTIRIERMNKYIEDIKSFLIKQVLPLKNQSQITTLPTQQTQQTFKSNFEYPSEITYTKYLMCPRLILLSQNNQPFAKFMFQMSLAKSNDSDNFENFFIWSEIDGPQDNVQKLSNLHYVHLEAKNRMCIQFKIIETQSVITIHIQLNSSKKQQKYYECLKFLCENKFFL